MFYPTPNPILTTTGVLSTPPAYADQALICATLALALLSPAYHTERAFSAAFVTSGGKSVHFFCNCTCKHSSQEGVLCCRAKSHIAHKMPYSSLYPATLSPRQVPSHRAEMIDVRYSGGPPHMGHYPQEKKRSAGPNNRPRDFPHDSFWPCSSLYPVTSSRISTPLTGR